MTDNTNSDIDNNTTSVFFEALFNGTTPEGYLNLWTKDNRKTYCYAAKDYLYAVELAAELGRKMDIYYEVGVQPERCAPNSRGKKDSVIGLYGLWLDVDIKGDNHAVENLPLTPDDAMILINAFPLKPTMIIHSGGGFHVHWLFEKPWMFSGEVDRERAKGLAYRFQQIFISEGNKYGWKVDSTADLSRLMRIPGTFNHKRKDNPREVRLETYDQEAHYSVDEIERHVLKEVSVIEYHSTPTIIREPVKKISESKKTDYLPADAARIESGCEWMAHCKNDAAILSEPEWYAMISILGRCENGEALVHEWSKPYPKYSKGETSVKLKHAIKSGGPCTCKKIMMEFNGMKYCGDCSSLGKIKSPIILGTRQKPMGKEGSPEESFSLTDLGNAERFVAQHGQSIKYCKDMKNGWLVWDGSRWTDNSQELLRLMAKQTIGSIYAEANDLFVIDKERANKIHAHAKHLESSSGLENMLRLAQGEKGMPIGIEEFDFDPWLLNCRNGVLNLKTGQLRPHDPKYLLTKIIPVDYDPQAQCDEWVGFVNSIMDYDYEMADYLQQVIGYSLTGIINEQCFFLLYGTGANGKTTFLETIRRLMGDYAKQTSFTTFIVKQNDNIRNDLAGLKGARFVTASEIMQDQKLSEVTLKQLTGGEPISARFLNHEFFEYFPTFKIFIAGNHKPRIQGTDRGIWRRIHLINFSVSFDQEEQDRGLGQRLFKELSGILRWAVEGCLKWQQVGRLIVPKKAMEDVDDYKAEMDNLSDFITQRCLMDPLAKIRTTTLYDNYLTWCRAQSFTPLTRDEFIDNLEGKDIRRSKIGGNWYWRGIAMIES